MRIGIMGGTFDPIHNGHLLLAEYAYLEKKLDEVWFLPNGNPPHKLKDNIESDIVHRTEMVKAAITGKCYFKIELYELNRKTVSYSYQTMEHFKEAYPEHTFYFIVGADSLFSLEQWKHPERLIKVCHLLAAYRGELNTKNEMNKEIEALNAKYHTNIALLKMPAFEVSSSEIRKRVKEGVPINGLVPVKVAAYINEHQLFKDD